MRVNRPPGERREWFVSPAHKDVQTAIHGESVLEPCGFKRSD